MSQLRFLLCLFSGYLLLSCNKGEFNPTQCDNCPELMSCYDGVCDCDRDSSFKIWNHCYWKLNRRSFYYTPDTGLSFTILILDSMGQQGSSGKYIYEIFTGEDMYITPLFRTNGKTRPYPMDARIYPQTGYDSIYFSGDWTFNFLVDGQLQNRHIYGVRYGNDSMELHVVHQNTSTWESDTLESKKFYRYE